jgi:hypothetical protein
MELIRPLDDAIHICGLDGGDAGVMELDAAIDASA